jgi:probable F420-dependent oxidoreductase
MRIGVFTLNPDDGADPMEFGRAAEQLGFESIFCGDHTHIPVSRETPFPMPPWEMPRDYYRMRDPFITLACVAAVTTHIKLGTAVCVVVERDPIALAKTTATLDRISGGRLLFGVGAGWNIEEMRNHGTDPKTRTQLLRERVEAIKRIWTMEKAEYHGSLVNFDPIYSWPKPVQQPHPPVILGGGGPTVLERVVAYADGWFPGHQRDLKELGERMKVLQELAAAAGRAPIPVSIMFGLPEFLDTYASMGAARVVIGVPAGPTETSIAALQELARRSAPFLDARN